MMYLILLALIFIFAAMSVKLMGKRMDALEARVFKIEDAIIQDTPAAEAVANGDAVEVKNKTEVVQNE